MLKGLAIFAAILAFIGTPRQVTKKNAGADQRTQQTQTDNRGTKDFPLVVEVNSVQSDKETSKEKSRTEKEDSRERWIIGLTFAIAVAAFLQVLGIGGQIFINRRQDKHMVASERAWLTVAIGKMPEIIPRNDQIDALFVRPTLKNRGQIVAKITKYRLNKIELPARAELPKEPDYTGSSAQRLDGELILLPEDAVSPFSVGLTSLAIVQNYRTGKDRFYIYGMIEYIDAFEKPHVTRFCFVYQFGAGITPIEEGFYPMAPSPAYSYAD